MLTITLASLYQHVNLYFWPLIRILALFSTSPIFNEKAINTRLKISVALIMTFLIAPTLPACEVTIFSAQGLWVGIQQIIIGTTIGLSVQLIFVAVRHAGEIIGLQMGLSFATFYDAIGGQNMPIIARILNLLVTLLFLTFNGHLYLIRVVADSFHSLPVDIKYLGADGFYRVAKAAGIIFRSGLMLGLPVATLLLCLNLTMGILNRLTPQLSIFAVGFPVTLSVGMLALSLVMYCLAPFFEQLMAAIFDNLAQITAGFQH